MNRYWDLLKNHFSKNSFSRFLLVGVGNSLFSYLIFSLLILMQVSVLAALVIAAIAGIVFNFFSTGGLVFRDVSVTKLPKFILAYVVVILLNYESLKLLSEIIVNPILAQAIVTPPLAIFSYFAMTNFVFKNKKNYNRFER